MKFRQWNPDHPKLQQINYPNSAVVIQKKKDADKSSLGTRWKKKIALDLQEQYGLNQYGCVCDLVN